MSTLNIGKRCRALWEPLFIPSDKWEKTCLVASLCCCVANDVVEGRGVKKSIFEICANIMKNFASVMKIVTTLWKHYKRSDDQLWHRGGFTAVRWEEETLSMTNQVRGRLLERKVALLAPRGIELTSLVWPSEQFFKEMPFSSIGQLSLLSRLRLARFRVKMTNRKPNRHWNGKLETIQSLEVFTAFAPEKCGETEGDFSNGKKIKRNHFQLED